MSSKIPAAIDGIIALATALQGTTLAGVNIYDGPKLDESVAGRRIIVGFDPQDMAAEGAQEWASMPKTGNARAERVTIHCVVESWSGQTNMQARRNDAFAILAALEGAIKTDPTLNGAVTYANLGEHIEVRQPQTSQGAVCTIFFGVNYYARFS